MKWRRPAPSIMELDGGLSRGVVVCGFPHAGAGATWVAELAELVPATWGICGVCLPGREARSGEPFAASVVAAAQEVAADIATVRRPGSRWVLYGQSFGALLGFESARELEGRDGASWLRALVVLGARPPCAQAPPVEDLGDGDLARWVRGLGLLDPRLLEDRGLAQRIFAVIRRDTDIFQNYRWGADERVATPIIAARGRDDSLVGAAECAMWRRMTTSPHARVVEVAGGHLPLRAAAEAWVPVAGTLTGPQDD